MRHEQDPHSAGSSGCDNLFERSTSWRPRRRAFRRRNAAARPIRRRNASQWIPGWRFKAARRSFRVARFGGKTICSAFQGVGSKAQRSAAFQGAYVQAEGKSCCDYSLHGVVQRVDDELLRFAREILRGGRHPE